MAKTFKFGENGKWATKTGSSLAYNDQNDNFKPMPFSVTRDGIATRVNKQGLIEVVGNDKLRIDYKDSSKGVALLEPARSNVVQYSEDFTQSAWVKTRASISSNVVISPDGTLTADKIISDATLNSHFIRDDISSTIGVASVFAKADEFTFLKLSTNAFSFQASYFDLANGTFNQAADHIAKIENYGNGWFRCSIYVSQAFTQFYVENAGNSASATHLGNGVSGIYIWGAQVEAGSYATSYIPTSGQSGGVPRAADVANGAGNSEVFNDSEGVLFANIADFYDSATSRVISISDATLNNRVFFKFYTVSNGIEATLVSSSGGSNPQVTAVISDTSNYNKIALKYSINGFNLWVNGFELGSDTVTNTPNNLSDISFDTAGLNDLYGKTKEIGVYDAVLTDAELEALTSYTSFTNMANELNLTIK